MNFKKPDSDWFLNEIINLITNPELSTDERNLLTSAKTALEANKDDRAVASALKTKLSFLAAQQKLSKLSTNFLSELSQHYVGPTGIGGRDVLINL